MAGNAFSWLRPSSVIEVSGPDAATFLQGQFTNDLSRLATDSPATYGLWLNVKGRVLADSHILRLAADRFAVFSFGSPVELIRRRMEDFIIADEVDLADRTAGHEGCVLVGNGTGDVLRDWGFALPPLGCYHEADGTTIFRSRTAGRQEAWHVVFPAGGADAWRRRLKTVAEITAEALAVRRCVTGVCSIPDEVGPGDLPNEAGLEHEAISFTKGCYLGQEVMARLKNLGQVRRRLFVVRLAGGDLKPGTFPVSLMMPDGKRVGELRSAFPDGDQSIGLAMLQLHPAKPGLILRPEADRPVEVEVVKIADGRAW